MKFKLTVVFAFLMSFAYAQKTFSDSLLIFAQSHFVNGDYKKAGQYYLDAFKKSGNKATPKDRFNAAKALAQSGQLDSSFAFLNILLETTQLLNEDNLNKEKKLDPLHSDARWGQLLADLKPKFPELAARLNMLFDSTQNHRRQVKPTMDKFGQNSAEHKAILADIARHDSLDRVEILKLLDEKGWLGSKDVGIKGTTMIFMVLQMSKLEVQEKYFPIVDKAAKEGKIKKANWATLKDQILVAKGQKQLYGTQFKVDKEAKTRTIYPVEDIDNMNKRREEVGLQTVSAEAIARQKEAQKE
jgi:hypothetical protein